MKVQNEHTEHPVASGNPSFDAFIWSLEKKWIMIVCVLGFTIVPLFGGLDFFIIPSEYLGENIGLFLLLRAGASLLVLGQFLILMRSEPGRWNAIHAYVFTFFVGGIISIMTVRLGGFSSSYYAGLNLVLIAVNLFLPWSAWKGALNSVILIAQYLAVNILFTTEYQLVPILNNLYFLLGTTMISVTIAHFKFGLTRSEFEKMNVIGRLKSQQDADYFLTSLILKPLSMNLSQSESVKVEFLTSQKKKFTFKKWHDEIGGDICVSNNLQLKGRSYVVVVNADAMGKSLQGAGGALVFGAVFHALVQRTKSLDTYQDQHPERWLKNAVIEMQKTFESFDGAMMISMVIGLIDEKTGVLYYINAEHPFSVLYRDGRASYIESELFFRKVGMLEITSRLFVSVFPMKPGDALIFGSDGRDDVMVTDSVTNQRRVINDEQFFLGIAARNDGDLKRIADDLGGCGEVIDDLSMLKITFQPVSEAAPQAGWKRSMDGLVDGARLAAVRERISAGVVNPAILKEAVSLSIRHGELEAAVDHARAMIDEYPGETSYLYFLARELFRQKKFSDAIEFGERFRNRKPDHTNNLLVLSHSYSRAGNPERAKVILHQVIAAEPANKFAISLAQSLGQG